MAFRKFVKERAKDIYEQRKLSKFLEEYCSKDDLQKLAKKLKLKTSGKKGQISKRIISIPEFDLDIIKQAFNKSSLQKISRDLGIPATGDKDELWTRIIIKKGITSDDSISIQTDNQLSQIISEKPEVQSNKVEKTIMGGFQSASSSRCMLTCLLIESLIFYSKITSAMGIKRFCNWGTPV